MHSSERQHHQQSSPLNNLFAVNPSPQSHNASPGYFYNINLPHSSPQHSLSSNTLLANRAGMTTKQRSNQLSLKCNTRDQMTEQINVSEQAHLSQQPLQQDKISSLHHRIKEEADKIRIWKTATELELKQKSDKLREMQSLIDEQRRSIVDMQLDYEKVSGLLQEEVSNQQQIGHQLSNTRELVSAIKINLEQVEIELRRGDDDSKDLNSFQEKIVMRYEELLQEFLALQEQTCHVVQRLEEELANKELKLNELYTDHHTSLDTITSLSQELSEKTHSFEETLEQLTSDLSSKETAYNEVILTNTDLLEKLDNLERNFADEKAKNNNLMNNFDNLQKDFDLKICEFNAQTAKFNELESKLASETEQKGKLLEKIKILENKIENLTNIENDLNSTKINLESQIENLKDKITKFDFENEENNTLINSLTNSDATSKQNNLMLEEKLILSETALNNTNTEYSELKDKYCKLDDYSKDITSSLSNLKLELVNCEKKYDDRILVLNNEINGASNKNEALTTELTANKKLNNTNTLEIESLKNNFDSLNSKLMQTQLELNETCGKLKDVCEEKDQITSELNEMKTKFDMTLSDNKNTIHKLQEDLLLLNNAHSEEIDNKNYELDVLKIASNLSLKSAIEKSEFQCENKIQAIEEKYNNVLESNQNLEQNFVNLELKYSEKVNETNNFAETLARERSEMDKRVADICASLANYKLESEKILTDKDREKENLRKENIILKQKEAGFLKQISELNSKIKEIETSTRIRPITSTPIISTEVLLETPHLSSQIPHATPYMYKATEDIQFMNNCDKDRRDLNQFKRKVAIKESNSAVKLSKTPKTPGIFATPKCSSSLLPLHAVKSNRISTASQKTVSNTPLITNNNSNNDNNNNSNNDNNNNNNNSTSKGNNSNSSSISGGNCRNTRKRKKIRLEDMSLEIIESEDETYSQSFHLSENKENISSMAQQATITPSCSSLQVVNKRNPVRTKGKAKTKINTFSKQKEYNWLDHDSVFGIGLND